MPQLHTCRFCKDFKHQESMLQYGPRHHAHLACLAEHKRLEDTLRKTPAWKLKQLPFFALKDLGVLPLVRQLAGVPE